MLSTHTSRRCLVFEKIKETADFSDEEQCRQKVREMATKFRENFYKAQTLSKTERKERMKKFGKLNLDDIEVSQRFVPSIENIEKATWQYNYKI